jgi:hypothetical protein
MALSGAHDEIRMEVQISVSLHLQRELQLPAVVMVMFAVLFVGILSILNLYAVYSDMLRPAFVASDNNDSTSNTSAGLSISE